MPEFAIEGLNRCIESAKDVDRSSTPAGRGFEFGAPNADRDLELRMDRFPEQRGHLLLQQFSSPGIRPAGAAFTAKLAVAHFSAGFVAFRPSGIFMQVRNYVRDDGKKIMLVPMSHVGESAFYQELAASFPANSVILMEGVTDTKRVAKARSGQSRIATFVGGVDQGTFFKPKGKMVAADLDMSAFSPVTLDLLKSVTQLEAKGVTLETLPILLKPMPPGGEKQLLDDLLTKRNHHLLGVIKERLPTSEIIIVPWGAAHMPEFHREIQKLGFRVVETKDYLAVRFGS